MGTLRIGVSVLARDLGFRRALRTALVLRALKHRLTGDKQLSVRTAPAETADALIFAFDPAELDDAHFEAAQLHALQALMGKPRFVLGLVAPAGAGSPVSDVDRKNAVLAGIARRSGAEFVPLMSRFMQAGGRRWLTADGHPTYRGILSIADAVLGAMERRAVHVSNKAPSRVRRGMPATSELFDAIDWPSQQLPQTLSLSPDWDSIADLLDRKVFFAGYPQWGKFALSDPVDWSMAGANRSWQSYFLGLEFLRPGLCYLNMALANDPNVLAVTEALQKRGHNTADVHAAIDDIMRDFIRANPAGASPNARAWAEGTICRRVKTFWMYLIYCKRLAGRGQAFDIDTAELVLDALVESLELLRNKTLYPKAGNHGVRQDSLLILSGLLLRGSPYGREILHEGFARLRRYQLAAALSRDGVWLENSTAYHLLVMHMLMDIAQDLRTADATTDASFIGEAIARMVPFAEAMLKPDGTPLLVGDTEPKSQSGLLLHARRFVEQIGGTSKTNGALQNSRAGEFLFPDAGYFVSRGDGADGSSVVFHATLSAPKHKHSDDLSLILSRGNLDLLIDGGAFNKEHSDSIRNAARFDPASHNTYRVNGRGYALRGVRRGSLAGITGTWRGRDWAAARGFNNAYPDGRIVRFVVHLKRHHGLIVLDWLRGSGPPVLFEQFWHVSPLFAQMDGLSDPNTAAFASSQAGYLLAAFDWEQADLAIEKGGEGNPIAFAMTSDHRIVPTPVIRRSKTLKSGFMASFFLWSPTPQKIVFTISAERDAALLVARADGLDCQFRIDERRVECLSLA